MASVVLRPRVRAAMRSVRGAHIADRGSSITTAMNVQRRQSACLVFVNVDRPPCFQWGGDHPITSRQREAIDLETIRCRVGLVTRAMRLVTKARQADQFVAAMTGLAVNASQGWGVLDRSLERIDSGGSAGLAESRHDGL